MLKKYLASFDSTIQIEMKNFKECKLSYTYTDKSGGRRLSKSKIENGEFFIIDAIDSLDAKEIFKKRFGDKLRDELSELEKEVYSRIEVLTAGGKHVLGFNIADNNIRRHLRISFATVSGSILYKDGIYKELTIHKLNTKFWLESDYEDLFSIIKEFKENLKKKLIKHLKAQTIITIDSDYEFNINLEHPAIKLRLTGPTTLDLLDNINTGENSAKFTVTIKRQTYGNSITIDALGLNRYKQLYKDLQKRILNQMDMILILNGTIYHHNKGEDQIRSNRDTFDMIKFMIETFSGKLDVNISYPNVLFMVSNDFLLNHVRATDKKFEFKNISVIPRDLNNSALLEGVRLGILDDLKKKMKDDYTAFALVSEIDDE